MQQDTARGAWAVPGSAAEQVEAPAGASVAVATVAATPDDPAGWDAAEHDLAWAGDGQATGPSVPHVALRPMTVADMLDGAFTIIKTRPRKIITLTAAFVAPVQVAVAYLQHTLGAETVFEGWASQDPTVVGEADPMSNGDLVATALLFIVPSIALVCVAAALAHLVLSWTVGHDASGWEMAGVVARRWWALLVTFVVVHVVEAVAAVPLIFSVPLLPFAMALFVVVAPVIGAEGPGPIAALRRAVRLVRPRYFPAMGILLLMALVSVLIGQATSALPQGLAVLVGLEAGWPLLALGGIAGQIVTTPFVAAATVLLYLDLRVRTEGLDLEMAARRVLDRAA